MVKVNEAKINFVETEKVELEGFTLIEGFPGMGLVGTIGAKYIAEKLKFKEIGHIDANIFIPIIRIHKGVPIYPSRIYANEKQKLVVIISEQIIPRYYTEAMAKAVCEWIQAKKIKRLISLEVINAGEEVNEKVYGIAANEKSKDLIAKFKISPVNEGITTGITSLMLLNLKTRGIEAISILGNVHMQADYKAAAAVIEKLNDILGLDIPVEPLLKEAEDTEKELLKHLQEMKKASDTVQKLEQQTPMYT